MPYKCRLCGEMLSVRQSRWKHLVEKHGIPVQEAFYNTSKYFDEVKG